MTAPTTLLTRRMRAERLRPEDLDDLRELDEDPQVMATVGGVRTRQQTRQAITSDLAHWEKHGFGLWLFRLRGNSRFVGCGGLHRIAVDGEEEIELHYALRAADWGRGLATEMAAAILELAFGGLGFVDVVAFSLPGNLASRRVMEKVGFEYEREIVRDGMPLTLYRAMREVPA